MTLDKKHITNFHRMIRQANNRTLTKVCKRDKLNAKQRQTLREKYTVTFYSVGEYGGLRFRPHYHTLMFGLHSLTIQKLRAHQIWNKGTVHIGQVTGASVGYVTSYMIDKNNVVDGVRQRPFSIMSKGIGSNYLKQKRKWHKQAGDHLDDYRYYVLNDDGNKQRLPRYYKDKIFSKIERTYLSDKNAIEAEENYEKELVRLEQREGSRIAAMKYLNDHLWIQHDLIRTKTIKLKKLR